MDTAASLPPQPEDGPVLCTGCHQPVWFDEMNGNQYVDATGDFACGGDHYEGLHWTDPADDVRIPTLRRYDLLLPEAEALMGPGVREKVECPVCPKGLMPFDDMHAIQTSGQVWDQIPHLNDFHEWSREAIAEWLKSLPFDLSVKIPEEYDR